MPECRIHRRPSVDALLDGVPVQVCAQCAVDGMDPTAGLGRPSIRRRVLSGPAGSEREEDVQRSIVVALREAGFHVLQTSRHRKRCVHCGKWSAGGDGADKGVPDLLVRDNRWPGWIWVGMEVKAPRGVLTAEQSSLVQMGAVVIVRSVEDAMKVMSSRPVPDVFSEDAVSSS